MPLLLVAKAERLPAISCGFAPLLERPHAHLPPLHDVGLGSEAAVGDGALAVTQSYGRAEDAVRAETPVAAGLDFVSPQAMQSCKGSVTHVVG
eukprot:9492199-Pyramimonas_sp.AAC.1